MRTDFEDVAVKTQPFVELLMLVHNGVPLEEARKLLKEREQLRQDYTASKITCTCSESTATCAYHSKVRRPDRICHCNKPACLPCFHWEVLRQLNGLTREGQCAETGGNTLINTVERLYAEHLQLKKEHNSLCQSLTTFLSSTESATSSAKNCIAATAAQDAP